MLTKLEAEIKSKASKSDLDLIRDSLGSKAEKIQMKKDIDR